MLLKRKVVILTMYVVILLLAICSMGVNTNTTERANESTVTVLEEQELGNIPKIEPTILGNFVEAENLELEETKVITEPTVTETIPVTTSEPEYKWDGEVLNACVGTIEGPSGKETYYNLDMSGIVSMMQNLGYDYEYHVREDGVKMFGPYVMCAANLDLRPRGSLVETSLGLAMVCDTGGFAEHNPTQIDIATNW